MPETIAVLASAVPAALFAGLVAVGASRAVEHFGGRVGGLLGTLPTTIVPASLGIFAQASPEGFAQAMDATPPGMLLNAVFLACWGVLPPRLKGRPPGQRLAIVVAVSLAVWAVLAVGLVRGGTALRSAGLGTAVLGWAGLGLLVALWLAATARNAPAPRGVRKVGLRVLLARGVGSALAIFAAVWVAALGGTLVAGVVAVFPAIFLTTMVAVWLAQGEAVQAGAVGPMMLGSASVAGYALWARALMPPWGAWGAAPAWGLAVLTVTLPAAQWLRWRQRMGIAGVAR